jgi:hypothetical protein
MSEHRSSARESAGIRSGAKWGDERLREEQSALSAPTKLPADTAKALKAALASEQVAVWSYDVVAAYDPADADVISTIRAGHLARQGATNGYLVAGGVAAPGPAPAYALPLPVTDPASARALSAVVEGDCASAWRAVLGSTDSPSLRSIALAGLADSAVWLTTLKMAAKVTPATVAFPGQANRS